MYYIAKYIVLFLICTCNTIFPGISIITVENIIYTILNRKKNSKQSTLSIDFNCCLFVYFFKKIYRVTRSVLCVCFVDSCLSFCPFSFGHCVVCPSSIYGFWLPLWYLQTLHDYNNIHIDCNTK